MTAVLPPSTLWNSMPGWGIAANLLPPEIVAQRRIRVLRRWIAVALVGVLALCVTGYIYANMQRAAAQRTLSAEQQHTTQLRADRRSYANIERMQGTIAQVQSRISTLMTGDIDVSGLITRLAAAAPRGVTISQLSLTLTTPNAKGSQSKASGVGALDTSGIKQIGTITMTGAAPSLVSVAAYVDRLQTVPGLLAVFPTSASLQGPTAQFSLLFSLGETLHSHRYDTAATAVKR